MRNFARKRVSHFSRALVQPEQRPVSSDFRRACTARRLASASWAGSRALTRPPRSDSSIGLRSIRVSGCSTRAAGSGRAHEKGIAVIACAGSETEQGGAPRARTVTAGGKCLTMALRSKPQARRPTDVSVGRAVADRPLCKGVSLLAYASAHPWFARLQRLGFLATIRAGGEGRYVLAGR